MPEVPVNDITLHYTTHGHGEPLLLIHGGWGLSINGFHYQEKTLAHDFRLIIPDRRGYGQSTHVVGFDADFHWQHADDLLKFLDALKIDRVRVWGHSDGAVIGAIMAILAPDRVRALVFEGGHLYNRKTESNVSDAANLRRSQPAARSRAREIGAVSWRGLLAAGHSQLGGRVDRVVSARRGFVSRSVGRDPQPGVDHPRRAR